MRTYRHSSRGAFTLVELLVVMSLIAVLATLAILFFPNAVTSQREARAAQSLQGWLNIAKQRALRDQAPRGLRLWVTTTMINANTFKNVVIEAQYLEQPDDFPASSSVIIKSPPQWLVGTRYVVNDLVTMAGNPGTTYLCRRANRATNGPPSNAPPGVDWTPELNSYIYFSADVLTNGYPATAANQLYWSVQPGDYLEIGGTGLMHSIVSVNPTNGNSVFDFLTVTPPLPTLLPTAGTTSFRIVRAPRAVGSETLTLPDFTMIDLNTNSAFPGNTNPLPLVVTDPLTGNGYVDILFSPTGQVITRGVSTTNLNLWVRSPSENVPTGTTADYFYGDPTLVSVFVQTGFVGAYPPNQGTPNPYALIR